ncbi:DUF2058 domain-containing protein [Arhodomonas sp. SL1]|uniref:DUF2058 domain-containing protein n=1 Tax=Arhodomonas sp. SL1 TaxID=3425691 RepID=UPI003F882583
MSNSLREQMLKAGLASEDDVKRVEGQKRPKKGAKKKKSQRRPQQDEAARQAALYDEAKRARDRDLNRQREAERQRQAEEKAARKRVIDAEIPRDERHCDVTFNFSHDGRIKKIHVSAEQQRDLAAGKLAIARTRGRYRLIPGEIAEQVGQAAPFLVIFRAEPGADEDPDYADYPVPDDLMW